MSRREGWRKAKDLTMRWLCLSATLLVTVPLLLILYHLVLSGARSINLSFFVQLPRPVGEAGGGMAHAILGSLILVGLAVLFAVPSGVMAGVCLAEFSRGLFGRAVRFVGDLLNGVPSIIVGIFVYTLIVLRMGRFSALAGGAALAIIMLPVVIRTTEEMLKLVPRDLREAALALGVREWRMIVSVVLRAAWAGILTGILLGMARVAGETAPLLFTAFGSNYWPTALDQPIAAMPLQIFNYAISPFEEWHRLAWAGALVLIILILGLSIAARLSVRRG